MLSEWGTVSPEVQPHERGLTSAECRDSGMEWQARGGYPGLRSAWTWWVVIGDNPLCALSRSPSKADIPAHRARPPSSGLGPLPFARTISVLPVPRSGRQRVTWRRVPPPGNCAGARDACGARRAASETSAFPSSFLKEQRDGAETTVRWLTPSVGHGVQPAILSPTLGPCPHTTRFTPQAPSAAESRVGRHA
jgi:hypothetical protein